MQISNKQINKATKSKQKQHKTRGKFLSSLLILDLFILLLTLTHIGDPQGFQKPYEENDLWLFISIIMHASILVGLFYWKRVAVYGFFLSAVIVFIVNLYLVYQYQPFGFVATGIIGLILYNLIWYWAIKRKWYLFE